MSKSGEIIIIEDDHDDRKFLETIIDELAIPNRLLWFDNGNDAYDYLCNTAGSAFIIMSDVNLPGTTGLDLKKRIDSTPKLRKKSIPFVFYSTLARQDEVNEAYTQMTVQGFFKKGSDYEENKHVIKTIFDYWRLSKHPNTH